MSSDRVPVSVLTGFLGSGKTTLLSRILHTPAFADTAVVINEFGEVGLDHELVRRSSEDIVLLDSGCLCCTVRGDLIHTLRDLHLRRVRGDVPEFARVVIETTGLADPAPILHTLMSDPLVAARYRLDGVVCTVDAVNAHGQLDAHVESVKQVAVADRLVLTKTDLSDESDLRTLTARLRALNPGAPLLRARQGEIAPELLLGAGLWNPATKAPDVERWLNEEAYRADHHHDHAHDVNRHDRHVGAFSLILDEPLPWPLVAAWLDDLAETYGERLLRVKGILRVAESERPVVVHGVQHLFHPPAELPSWPSEDRRSRLVFITRDLGREPIVASLRDRLSAAGVSA